MAVAIHAAVRDGRLVPIAEAPAPLALQPVGDALADAVQPLPPLAERARRHADAVLAQEKTLVQAGRALRDINRHSADLLEAAETVAALKLQQGASPAQVASVQSASVQFAR